MKSHELDNERERVLWQLFGKDNWECVDEVDSFLFVFDTMPPRMKMCVDYRVQGRSIREISNLMEIGERGVQQHLLRAKKRIANALI